MSFPIQAEKVVVGNAERVAVKHLELRHQKNYNLQQVALKQTVPYYVFNVNWNVGKNQGFIIVAGDDIATPILGYSDNGLYDENNLPPNFAFWMDCISQEISAAIKNGVPQSAKIKAEWEPYLSENKIVLTRAAPYVEGTHLIQTTWGQGAPYNDLCPLVSGTRTLTGCVATAMAQIMNFHQYPTQLSVQIPAYTPTTQSLSIPAISPTTNYDWANMQANYTGSEAGIQKSAVATLMYHCGASVKMDYDVGSSGAVSYEPFYALKNYFDYDEGIKYVFKHTDGKAYYISDPKNNTNGFPFEDGDWIKILKAQIDAGLPFLYGGTKQSNGDDGHMWVCDGYKTDNTFHFNWGWSGASDGWFATELLSTPNNYSENQSVIINIKPAATPIPDQGIVYVKEGGTGNGSSWEHAYPNLADPLEKAKSNPDIKQIWVASGTYYPMHKPAVDAATTTTTNRDMTFMLVDSIKIYGGFAGNETSLAARGQNPAPTILSGNIGSPNTDDNCYHVITAVNVKNCMLDGFIISDGNASEASSISVESQGQSQGQQGVPIEIERNYGGGVYNYNSSLILTNILLKDNTAKIGSAFYNK
ncbi:hypothetical protein FACS1894199_07640 [Bacteroidia bacterium]|nr:hypothetical protein FACS1894199_07640 [Bacteroidia bacterium]